MLVLDKVNPSSVILSGVLMLEHLGWNEAAKLIMDSMEKSIASKVVTYDFARLMDGAKEVKCSEFADELIKNCNISNEIWLYKERGLLPLFTYI